MSEVIDAIEDLGDNIGPYQTEGFKELTFTIKDVSYPRRGSCIVRFFNGEEVLILTGEVCLDKGIYIPYRDGYRVLMNFDYYRDGDTMVRLLTNDRILFYLTMIGSK